MKYVIKITWLDDSVSYASDCEGRTTMNFAYAAKFTAMDASLGAAWWKDSINRFKNVCVVQSYHVIKGQVNELVVL